MLEQVSAQESGCRHDGRLSHVVLVEQAKGVLMDWFEMPPVEARSVLDGWADRCGVQLCELAEALTRGVCQGRATSCDDAVLRQVEDCLRQLPTAAPSRSE